MLEIFILLAGWSHQDRIEESSEITGSLTHVIQEIRLRDRHCALATMRHHRKMGRSGWVDFDGCDLLFSGQLRDQPTSAGARLKYVIRYSSLSRPYREYRRLNTLSMILLTD